MRLDAAKGDIAWTVYHAERCKFLDQVRWLDDETCQWAELILPVQRIKGQVAVTIHQARRITILSARRLVIINPIEDSHFTRSTDLIVREDV